MFGIPLLIATGLVALGAAPPPSSLTAHDAAVIRSCVYASELRTAFPADGPWARREILVLPDPLRTVSPAKRRAVGTLLLDIVKGGRPADSRLAAAYLLALAGDPLAGRIEAALPLDGYDTPDPMDGTTQRDDTLERGHEALRNLR